MVPIWDKIESLPAGQSKKRRRKTEEETRISARERGCKSPGVVDGSGHGPRGLSGGLKKGPEGTPV